MFGRRFAGLADWTCHAAQCSRPAVSASGPAQMSSGHNIQLPYPKSFVGLCYSKLQAKFHCSCSVESLLAMACTSIPNREDDLQDDYPKRLVWATVTDFFI